MTTVLLGPQRFRTTAGGVVAALAPEGTVATVTAGWVDREAEDGELHEVMGGRTRNLRLFARLMDSLAKDERFSAAALAHRDAIDELTSIYSLRVQRALDTVYAVQRLSVREDIESGALADGVRALRAIDDWYLRTVADLKGDLEARVPADQSEVVLGHRQEVAEILADASVLAIAGGHVAMLLRGLELFDVTIPAALPVVAWSAGAMAMTDRVVLYNDRGFEGLRGAEVWDAGVGRIPGIIAMPHARRRLRLDDPDTVQILVRRFAGAACLLLDDGAKVAFSDDGELPAGARVLTDHGTIGTVGGLP